MRRLTAGIMMLALVALTQVASAERPVVNIGIALDGDLDLREVVIKLLQPELEELTRAEFDVRLPYEKMIQADATIEGVRRSSINC
jgi:hypothetical protein